MNELLHQTLTSRLLPEGILSSGQLCSLILASLLTAFVCGLLAFAFRRQEALSDIFGFWGTTLSALLALPVAIVGLSGTVSGVACKVPLQMPIGSFIIGADALSSLFLLPLLLLGPLAALHSRGYLKGHGHANGTYWLLFNILFASMILVLCACDGILFLLAWELMGVSSFALVAFNHKEEQARSAAWKYLVASQIGAACLMAMFVTLGSAVPLDDLQEGPWLWARMTEIFNFQQLEATQYGATATAAAFILALLGFGLKAGFVPLHVWLPEAHPAAPAPVSALMSGVMIKLGIYGILRVISMLGEPCAWWGWTLLAIGAITGIYGAICALSQSDLKRLLAYSSVENIGIIAIGLGLGFSGLAGGELAIGMLGFSGAFIHILNHSAMKGLLFLSAGAVAKSTGTLEMDRLGGLMKRMPWTGSGFVVGSAAISGLPPFNGFIGEFLILLACFQGVLSRSPSLMTPSIVALGSLAVIGGLAPAIFAKATGTVFLGEPRTEAARNDKEVGPAMLLPQLTLAFLCIGLSVIAPKIVVASVPAIAKSAGLAEWELSPGAFMALGPLFMLGLVSSALLILLALLALLRGHLPRASQERRSITWDCGYAAPTAKMQYSGSSLAQPLKDIFRFVFRPTDKLSGPEGAFPSKGSYSSALPDVAERWIIAPVFKAVNWLCDKLHGLQSGHLHLYIVLIMAALLLMLLWAWLNIGGVS